MPAGAVPVFSPGAAGAGDPFFPEMGNGEYDVSHHDINLAFDPQTKAIRATTTVLARATQTFRGSISDFQGPLTISRLTVNGRSAKLHAQLCAGAGGHAGA